MSLSVSVRRVLLGLGIACGLLILCVAMLLWTAPGYSTVEWLVGRVAGERLLDGRPGIEDGHLARRRDLGEQGRAGARVYFQTPQTINHIGI